MSQPSQLKFKLLVGLVLLLQMHLEICISNVFVEYCVSELLEIILVAFGIFDIDQLLIDAIELQELVLDVF